MIVKPDWLKVMTWTRRMEGCKIRWWHLAKKGPDRQCLLLQSQSKDSDAGTLDEQGTFHCHPQCINLLLTVKSMLLIVKQ